MTSTPHQHRILWTQVLGLAAVQGAIVLMWVIYNLYLGELLRQFGFTPGFIAGILVLENGLAMIMEPLMGTFSDRLQYWLGSRFPWIAFGVMMASGMLIATSALVVFGQPVGILRWLLPILLVAWAIAMALFRSPVLALLGRFALESHLPQAASVLTITGALAGSMGPLANEFILGLGPVVAFGLASLVLLGAATTLRAVNPNLQVTSLRLWHRATTVPLGRLLVRLILVFLAGLGISLGFRLQMFAFPKILKTIPELNVGLTMGTIFITLAVTALPAGAVARRLGNRWAMLLGLTGLAGTLGIMMGVQQSWAAVAVAIALGACLSLVNNGTLPFALSMVPKEKAGLGIGMFFSGAALAANVFGPFFKGAETMTPPTMILAAIVSMVVAMLAIAASYVFTSTTPRPP